jgi:hypothetical protein
MIRSNHCPLRSLYGKEVKTEQDGSLTFGKAKVFKAKTSGWHVPGYAEPVGSAIATSAVIKMHFAITGQKPAVERV